MSQRCFLEVYTKHNKLKNSEQVKYWNKYMELVEPVLHEITNPINGVVYKEKLYELLPEFKNSNFPLKYYSKVDNDYFVFDKELCFKYIVPDTFLMPFKSENIEYSHLEDYDPINEQFSGCHFKCTTTIKEGISVLENRLSNLEESEFKNSCNDILTFLKKNHEDSLLVLNSGDICIEEHPDHFLEEINNIKKMFERIDSK